MQDFNQHSWNTSVREDARALIRLAVREDLDRSQDWTTIALVPPDAQAAARIVSREAGRMAGMQVAQLVVEEMNLRAQLEVHAQDGQAIAPGQCVARLTGNARDLLTGERTLLNFLGRLAGIATQTQRYVQAIQGTSAAVYDTRKTAPGWRRLEKYAVHCGGGRNHRTGLYDAILIKDNHLALGAQHDLQQRFTPAEAVLRARQCVAELVARGDIAEPLLVEIELDNLAALPQVLAAKPDIILLDNMPPARLTEAVAMRNAAGSVTQLEASGGVRFETIRAIAETGVERISCGALTHSAVNFDFGLDWESV